MKMLNNTKGNMYFLLFHSLGDWSKPSGQPFEPSGQSPDPSTHPSPITQAHPHGVVRPQSLERRRLGLEGEHPGCVVVHEGPHVGGVGVHQTDPSDVGPRVAEVPQVHQVQVLRGRGNEGLRGFLRILEGP